MYKPVSMKYISIFILGLFLAACVSTPVMGGGSRGGVQGKMKRIQKELPKWQQQGGDPSIIQPLGKKVGELMEQGKQAEAEQVADEILAIISVPPGSAPVTSSAGPKASNVQVLIYDADGRPVPQRDLVPKMTEVIVTGVVLMDGQYNPVPFGTTAFANGQLSLADPVPSSFIISFYPKVPGFGKIKVFADNGGMGYRNSNQAINFDLPFEGARSRIAKVIHIVNSNPGVVFSQKTKDFLGSAQAHLQKAGAGGAGNAKEVYAALRDALWAGELATYEQAKFQIAKRGKRTDFKFGIFNEGYQEWGRHVPKQDFETFFNFATIPTFFFRHYEAKKGRPNHEDAEKNLAWLNQFRGLEYKGHPLVYLVKPNVPDWLKNSDMRTFQDAMRTRILRDVGHFKGRIQYWDVINEAHAPHDRYTQKEILELARMATEAVKQADPAAQRVINVNRPLGEVLVTQGIRELYQRGMATTAYQYVKDLQNARIQYEVLGIQVYDPGLDMMEMSRLIDRFAALGKPIHLTEVAVAAAPGKDRKLKHFQERGLEDAMAEWHAPWTEQLQADWIVMFYTIMYAKPGVTGIMYTHFEDTFWPYGGLLRKNLEPRKAYHELLKLMRSWGY